jgi:hypothetical protein
MVIDCRVCAAAFEPTQKGDTPSTTHYILENDKDKWEKSSIRYSQLALNSKLDKPPQKTGCLSQDIYNFLSYERGLGPHIWIEFKVPTHNKQDHVEYNNLLAVGVLPLIHIQPEFV